MEIFSVPKFPLVVANGPDQIPKLEGLPPKLLNKFIGTAVAIFVSQILIFPLIPASKTASTVTVTVAESEGQVAFPVTV